MKKMKSFAFKIPAVIAVTLTLISAILLSVSRLLPDRGGCIPGESFRVGVLSLVLTAVSLIFYALDAIAVLVKLCSRVYPLEGAVTLLFSAGAALLFFLGYERGRVALVFVSYALFVLPQIFSLAQRVLGGKKKKTTETDGTPTADE